MQQAIISLAVNAICFVFALALFAGFGPAIPLPGGLPGRIIDIKSLEPAALPLEGVLAPNDALKAATLLFNGTLQSSESILVEEDGSLLLMDKFGFVLRATPDASGAYSLSEQPLTRLGLGRPLAFKKHPVTGHIIVCVAGMGLVEVQLPNAESGTPAKVVLLGAYVSSDSPVDPNTSIQYANALDITSDGSAVYFTDSQVIPVSMNYATQPRKPWYDTFASFLMGLYSGQRTGRLLAYYPATGAIHVLKKGFFYANGVALSPDESNVVLAETSAYRVGRVYVKGDKAGKAEVLVERLPGFPDGITRALDGKGYWVALPCPRTGLVDAATQYRVLRVALAYLPAHLRPKIPTWGAVLLVSESGEITQFLQDPTGSHVSLISSVEEVKAPSGGPRLWLSSVTNHYLAYLDL